MDGHNPTLFSVASARYATNNTFHIAAAPQRNETHANLHLRE